jgi:uncharacterized protein with NRDE domain
MCTVTFLPLPGSGFILTSNRDEQLHRLPALPPQWHQAGAAALVFPKDTQAGGTWIASSGKTTVCLLNGAFDWHMSRPPYRKSRGLMVLDFFNYPSVQEFVTSYAFDNMEPFTLLVVNHSHAPDLTEIRWTESGRLHVTAKDTAHPHIWSSATLYTSAVQEQRRQWFSEWLAQHPDYQPTDIRAFHQHANAQDPTNSVLMRRSGVATVSITSVVHTSRQTSFWYKDLKHKETTSFNLELLSA